MKIRGEIFKKRFYPYHEYENIDCICFLKVDDSIEIGKDRIKIIPILSEESTVSNIIGKLIVLTVKLSGDKLLLLWVDEVFSLPLFCGYGILSEFIPNKFHEYKRLYISNLYSRHLIC